MRKHISVTLTMILVALAAFGDIRLPNALSSNMVLQQKSSVKLWGWAGPSEKILITTSWNNKTDTVLGTCNADWVHVVQTPAAGGPYTITFKGRNTVVLSNILIGEVWVCSGQSNMERSSEELQQMRDELPHSANDGIRLFNMPKTTATTPQDNAPGEWQVCGPETLKGFSAVAYFFGKKLQEQLHVPIGLINASWGGTPAEVWTPAEIVNNDNALQQAAGKKEAVPWWPIKPGYTYNGMIHPLTNFSIGGAIWYQGESNVTTSSTYSRLFTAMIDSWRKAWQKEFPFYYVQIAPFNYTYKNTGALLQEQQLKSLSAPKTGMVVITDLVDNIKDIHPQNKKDVGDRLARYALSETYGQNIGMYKSPLFKKMEMEGSKALLYFDNAPNGFMIKNGKAPSEFYIAGADKRFLPATAKIEKGRIVVSSKEVKQPVAVRFAFSNTAIANLFSKEGFPVCPFRTDNWEVDTSAL